ncbi:MULTISPECIES: hypothetical protein [Solirubrobacterales]|nr:MULTISPECIES: hypothetical protein [Solirubrobacterales]
MTFLADSSSTRTAVGSPVAHRAASYARSWRFRQALGRSSS